MIRQLIFRPKAEDELQEAFLWYEQRVPGLGDEFLAAVDRTLQRIRQNPQQYPLIQPQIRRALTHRFPYQILYTTRGSRIIILAVFHCLREPHSWNP